MSSYVKNQLSFNKMIETKLAQIVAAIPVNNEGKIPGQPENSFEKVNVVTTRCGTCNTLVLSIAFGTCISWAQASSKHSWAWAYEISSYSYILSHVMLIIYMHMPVIMCDQCKRWLWGHKNTLDTSRMVNGTMLYSWHGPILLLSVGLL